MQNNPLWRFALEKYDTGNNQENLLAIQDKYGLSIMFILYLAWLGTRQISINEAAMHKSLSNIAFTKEEILDPLRKIRKRSKNQPDIPNQIYQQLKSQELQLENAIAVRLYLDAGHLKSGSSKNNTSHAKNNILLYAQNSAETDTAVDDILFLCQGLY